MSLLPAPDPPTPAWLTEALRLSGALPRGSVAAIDSRASGAFNSATSFLEVRYSAEAPPDAPARLVLKRNVESDWAFAAAVDEVRFYRLAAELPGHPPVTPPCFGAESDEASRSSYILLRDLSETHAPPLTRDQLIAGAVPRGEDLAACVDVLAALHAFWWGHPLVRGGPFEVGYWHRDAARHAAYLARRRASWARLQEAESGWLPPELRAFYDELLDALPAFWERQIAPRFESRASITLTHGDAYLSNFLRPRAPGERGAFLLDWQSPTFDIGAYDLVNMCATFWTPAQRREGGREEAALRRYLAGLEAGGVAGYGWPELCDDYRAGLVCWALMPVQDGADGAPRDYWWPKVRCTLAAFDEWGCAELLGVRRPGGLDL